MTSDDGFVRASQEVIDFQMQLALELKTRLLAADKEGLLKGFSSEGLVSLAMLAGMNGVGLFICAKTGDEKGRLNIHEAFQGVMDCINAAGTIPVHQ
jgi:hypothetical protein